MRHAVPFAALLTAPLVLSSCASMQSDDPSLLSFRIPEGSKLALEQAIEIPDGQTHIMIQSGKLITESRRNQYELSCRVNFRQFGPRTVEPEVFSIRRTEHGEGWESRPNFYFYTTEIFLDSDKGTDIIKMECTTWAVPPSTNFSIADIGTTLGDYFTFKFSSPESPKQ